MAFDFIALEIFFYKFTELLKQWWQLRAMLKTYKYASQIVFIKMQQDTLMLKFRLSSFIFSINIYMHTQMSDKIKEKINEIETFLIKLYDNWR